MRRASTGLVLLLLALSASAEWQEMAPGVEYQRIRRDTIDAHVVRVDVTRADLRVMASSEAHRGLTVSDFAKTTDAIVAINADYFDLDTTQPIGMAMDACGVWAKANETVRRQEVVGVGKGRVQICPRAEPLRRPKRWMTGAVSGWPMVVSGCDPVEKLPGSDHFTRAPHPRTAVGVSSDGKTLYLVVADGRREGVPGMTLPELGRFLDELGACTALNLDGGGSTAMWVRDRIVNSPSDGPERTVGNHLAIVAAGDYAGCERRVRSAKE